jgi:hypothetical protein
MNDLAAQYCTRVSASLFLIWLIARTCIELPTVVERQAASENRREIAAIFASSGSSVDF